MDSKYGSEGEYRTGMVRAVDPLSADPDERLQFALAAGGVGVFEWTPSSDDLTWSSITTGLGITGEDAPTSGRAFFDFVHPDDQPALRDTRDRATREGVDAESEFRIIAPDGSIHWVHAHGRVVPGADGKPVKVLGVNIEITRRKLLEEQLRQAQLQVERLNVLKATMLTVQGIVSNALMSLQLFRLDAEQHVSSASLEQFDSIIHDTASKLKALGSLDRVVETKMAMGTGIDYRERPPTSD